MSILSPVIETVDVVNKRIYLKSGVREYHPVTDIYAELRALRRNNESLRVVDMPVKAFGNIPKGGGKYTPRYAVFYDGWKVVPEDVSHSLYVTGEQITDDGQSGPACIDTDILSSGTSVIIQYEPPAAEIIRADKELEAIQWVAFNNVVSIDIVNGKAGTEYPLGTVGEPVNNLADALAIAQSRNINDFFVKGNLTIANGDFSGYRFIGYNAYRSLITIDPTATFSVLEISEATITGYFSGNCIIRNSLILDIYNYSGIMFQTAIGDGVIQLAPNSTSLFLDTYTSLVGGSPNFIDFNFGDNISFNVRSHSGRLLLQNCDKATCVGKIEVSGGSILFDSTVTAGSFGVAGTADLIDNSNGATVDSTRLVHTDEIASKVWNTQITDNLNAKEALKQIKASLLDKVIISSDGQLVTIYDEDGATILKQLQISTDQKTRTPL